MTGPAQTRPAETAAAEASAESPLTGTPAGHGQPDQGPWERWGWVMGVVWLIFLFFPITATASTDGPPLWRAVTVGIIVAFGGVVASAFVRVGRVDTEKQLYAVGRRHLSLMLVLFLLTIPVAGWSSLGMVVFFVSTAWFTLPARAAAVVFAVVTLTTVVVPLIGGVFGQTWFFLFIVLGVGVATGLIRVFDDRQVEHQRFTSDLALAEERDRVARDVHDVLGHSLTVITLKAELVERLVEVDPGRATDEAHQIRDVSRQALAEIRATVGGLRVARLADEIASATAVLGDAGIEAQMPPDVEVVDPRHRIVLAWALREAVTNVVRHSDARHCRVELGADHLVVADDGRGMTGRREGNGIRGLRERVGAAGGALTVGTGPDDRGTSVRVHW